MKKLLIFISIISFFIGCDRPECTNTNAVFNTYQPSDEAYKTELAAQVTSIGKENLSYWIENYIEHPTGTSMSLHVQNDKLCAVMVMHISKCEKLEWFMNVKGASYRGAEMAGLDFDIIKDSSGTQFFYKNHDRIID